MAKVQSTKKTNYIFKVFPKDFLKPYGEATEVITDEIMERRLQPFSCELFRRPHIELSETAQTVLENFRRFQQLRKLVEKSNEYVVLLFLYTHRI